MHASTITDEERRLGFTQAYVTNPHSGWSLIQAVVLGIGDSDRILKLAAYAVNRPHYLHERFGTFQAFPGTPGVTEWRPAADPSPYAESTIQAARRGNVGALAQRVTPVPASIALGCPACRAEFSVCATHLPVDGTRTCPSCCATRRTEEFNFEV